MIMDDKLKTLDEWIRQNYNSTVGGWGSDNLIGYHRAIYDIGCILGLNLKKPDTKVYE
jgi:hypothetical protein